MSDHVVNLKQANLKFAGKDPKNDIVTPHLLSATVHRPRTARKLHSENSIYMKGLAAALRRRRGLDFLVRELMGESISRAKAVGSLSAISVFYRHLHLLVFIWTRTPESLDQPLSGNLPAMFMIVSKNSSESLVSDLNAQ